MDLDYYVINLDSAKDRLTLVDAQMKSINQTYHRWTATSGQELDSSLFGIKEVMEGIFITGFREWSKNEAACGVSHIRIWQKMVRENIPYLAILEDDVQLLGDLPRTIEELCLPPDAEIVLLNARSKGGEDVKYHCNRSNYSYREVIGGAGTDGYLLTLSGAKKLLKVLYPLNDPLDFQMFSHFASVQSNDTSPFYWRLPQNNSARGILLRAYRIEPTLVDQVQSIDSTIGGQRHPRARYYCRVLLNLNMPELNSYYSSVLNVPSETYKYSLKRIEYRGVDISHIDTSLKYFDHNNISKEPIKILAENGVNVVRISVMTDTASSMSLKRALKLAGLAYQNGIKIYLVLHYSDSWADPSHQAKPKAWSHLKGIALEQKVYDYTLFVLTEFASRNIPIEIVQIGNEITNGMLWEYEDDKNVSWSSFTSLLKSASCAIRDFSQQKKMGIKIMLQIDKGAEPEFAIWWFEKLRTYNIDYDIIGLSFYYLWHGATLPELKRLSSLEISFPDKYVMIAETSYPYYHAEGITVSPSYGEPMYSKDGQREYVHSVRLSINSIANGCGFCYWGGFFLNNRYDRVEELFQAQALFDNNGRALPVLEAFNI